MVPIIPTNIIEIHNGIPATVTNKQTSAVSKAINVPPFGLSYTIFIRTSRFPKLFCLICILTSVLYCKLYHREIN